MKKGENVNISSWDEWACQMKKLFWAGDMYVYSTAIAVIVGLICVICALVTM